MPCAKCCDTDTDKALPRWFLNSQVMRTTQDTSLLISQDLWGGAHKSANVFSKSWRAKLVGFAGHTGTRVKGRGSHDQSVRTIIWACELFTGPPTPHLSPWALIPARVHTSSRLDCSPAPRQGLLRPPLVQAIPPPYGWAGRLITVPETLQQNLLRVSLVTSGHILNAL